MEQKINIAELLKDCPSGMELDCAIWDNVVFDHIDMESDYPIYIKKMEGGNEYLTKNGCFNFDLGAKCVIFPKGKTTWEGFVPPCKFKGGDIVYVKSNEQNEYIIIFKEIKNDHIHKYVCLAYQRLSIDKRALCHLVDAEIMRLATEEEKQKLFQAIKDNGYKWNPETKTLEKLPKFKVGDRIRHCRVEGSNIYRVVKIEKSKYVVHKNIGECDYHIDFEVQDDWELVPDKFDITTLKPFESRVLVRDFNDDEWCPAIWGVYGYGKVYPHIVVSGNSFIQCIPYEKNEHLLGTTNDCDDYYKTWK